VALILEKARTILLLKISKTATEAEIKNLFSAEDVVLLETLATSHAPANHLNAAALAALLVAYDETGRAYIPTLPLELAVISIVGQNKPQAA
jgi:hypothetical protein